MIEIRTFDGTAAKLADFCTSVWRKKYANTDMVVPMWSEEFLDWDLFRDSPQDRLFLVAAYDRTKLVGVLPCRPLHYRIRGEPVFGTFGSNFSVDPDYEMEGVAMKLNLEQIRRHRQYDAKFLMGLIYFGASAAKGKDFWLRQPRTMNIVSKLGHWIRILDHKVVAEFERSVLHRFGLRSLGMFQSSPKAQETDNVRAFQKSDLPDCFHLTEELSASAEFAITWDENSLGRQLAYQHVPHTLVAIEGGRAAGFVNFRKLELLRSDEHGHRSITAGIIDLLHVDNLSSKTARRLVNSALRRMQEEGYHLAMVLRVRGSPSTTLLRCGFLMQPADHYLTAQEMSPGLKFPEGIKSLHVMFR